MRLNTEQKRLRSAVERKKDWKLWGPYLSERAWGTVREDYSADGSAWGYFPFDMARYRAYRWNEDGIAAICDRSQRICFGLALWNGADEILKERMFGLSGEEGNHGEDVKECYYYLDSTPTHSYMSFLYKYPQKKFPYDDLRKKNGERGREDEEYELLDTGVFSEDRYFDVFVEYAKADHDDICIRITAVNHGGGPADLHILPTIWFRNTWSWSDAAEKPMMREADIDTPGLSAIWVKEEKRGLYWLLSEEGADICFTENETNFKALYGSENPSPYTKDGIGECVVKGNRECINPDREGTKASVHFKKTIAGGEKEVFFLRLSGQASAENHSFGTAGDFRDQCAAVFAIRQKDADEFYRRLIPENLGEDAGSVMRQSLAGLLWSKQYYKYSVKEWLDGDPAYPPPPAKRKRGRNSHWRHVYAEDIISMPDAWEYPWFAAWDLAFHAIPLALVDPDFAKRQLLLLLREWYMHPNGQIPAYEWAFDDVNPPVHAYAALRVFQIEKRQKGRGDYEFLERVFHKLLLNFTWWVNRKDSEGDNVFEGGFLGLDNIGVFERSKGLPAGGHLEQADGTSWMAMYSLNMMAIALELAGHDEAYEDVATKFFEHFMYISHAINNMGHDDIRLWDERDGFFYDVLHLPGRNLPLKVRSMVGLIPLFAVEVLEESTLERFPNFKRRTEWFLDNRPEIVDHIACLREGGINNRRLLALVGRNRLNRILRIMLSESEFLSGFGIRALSRFHRAHPYKLNVDGGEYEIDYEPGESRTSLFGGNSNWRGPIWFPMNFLIIESLQKFDYYFGETLKVEFPTGSERTMTLWDVARELERRLSALFLRDEEGRRPVFGSNEKFNSDENFSRYPLFYEYFHGESGKGLGASHQTGWTALVAKVLKQLAEYESKPAAREPYK